MLASPVAEQPAEASVLNAARSRYAAEAGIPATTQCPPNWVLRASWCMLTAGPARRRPLPGITQYQKRAQLTRGLSAACCLALIGTAKCLSFSRGLQ